MGKIFKSLIIGMAAGAALGIAFDPLSSKEKKMMKRKVERALENLR